MPSGAIETTVLIVDNYGIFGFRSVSEFDEYVCMSSNFLDSIFGCHGPGGGSISPLVTTIE